MDFWKTREVSFISNGSRSCVRIAFPGLTKDTEDGGEPLGTEAAESHLVISTVTATPTVC